MRATRFRGVDWAQLQKLDIVKLQDGALSSMPDRKHLPSSVWRQCEVLGAINQIASLVLRHDPEGNEWRIVFKLIKAIDRASALGERRGRSGGTHVSDPNSTPPGSLSFTYTFEKTQHLDSARETMVLGWLRSSPSFGKLKVVRRFSVWRGTLLWTVTLLQTRMKSIGHRTRSRAIRTCASGSIMG